MPYQWKEVRSSESVPATLFYYDTETTNIIGQVDGLGQGVFQAQYRCAAMPEKFFDREKAKQWVEKMSTPPSQSPRMPPATATELEPPKEKTNAANRRPRKKV
jgi:hypothetical protein